MRASRVRIDRQKQAIVILPESWPALFDSGVEAAQVAVAGGVVLLDPRHPDQEIGAWLIDTVEAAWWLAGVFGEDVAQAVLGHGGMADDLIDVEWGALAEPLRRLAMASWLHRWWPSTSSAAGIGQLDDELLLAEIGTAAWQAEPCLADDTLFTELLANSAAPVFRALARLDDLNGTEHETASQLAWTSVRAVLEEGDAEQPGWAELSSAWRERERTAEIVQRFMAELERAQRPSPQAEPALIAGEDQLSSAARVEMFSVDWAQVNPRMVANQVDNVVITTAEDDSSTSRVVDVQVLAGDQPAPRGLFVRIYAVQGDGLPLAQLELQLADGIYSGTTTVDSSAELCFDVYHRDYVASPRFDAQPTADRNFVAQVVGDRLRSALMNPVGPFMCELLNDEPA